MPNFYLVNFKNIQTAIKGSLPVKGTWNFKGLSFSAEFSSEISQRFQLMNHCFKAYLCISRFIECTIFMSNAHWIL